MGLKALDDLVDVSGFVCFQKGKNLLFVRRQFSLIPK